MITFSSDIISFHCVFISIHITLIQCNGLESIKNSLKKNCQKKAFLSKKKISSLEVWKFSEVWIFSEGRVKNNVFSI